MEYLLELSEAWSWGISSSVPTSLQQDVHRGTLIVAKSIVEDFVIITTLSDDNKYEFVRYQLAGAPGVLADKNASASISRAN